MAYGVSLFGDWKAAELICNTMSDKWQRAAKKAMLAEGQFLRKKVIEGIDTQAPGGVALKPLSPITMAIRAFEGFKGTKALVRRADMRNSIVSVPVSGGAGVFVGVLRSAKSKTGKDLVNVAKMQEEGATIVVPITPKSRRFFHAALAKAGLEVPKSGPSHGGVAIAIIRIPPRPFLAPVFDAYGKPDDVRARFFARVAVSMGGDLGTP